MHRQRHKENTLCVLLEDWSDGSTGQGTPKIACEPQEAGRGEEAFGGSVALLTP